MRWTKVKSRNAVAAKARKLMQQTAADWPDEPRPKLKLPRLSKPDFIIRIESAKGERVSYSIRRMFGKVFISEGLSARQFCRGLEHLITKSA